MVLLTYFTILKFPSIQFGTKAKIQKKKELCYLKISTTVQFSAEKQHLHLGKKSLLSQDFRDDITYNGVCFFSSK